MENNQYNYNEISAYNMNEFRDLIEESTYLKIVSMDSDSHHLNVSFAISNSQLDGTQYLYSKSKKILHFTSLSVLYSIINEGAIRLYNLNNSNDKKEYLYASRGLEKIYNLQGRTKEYIIKNFNWIKKNMFIFSCTEYTNSEKPELWKSYGFKGKGVAIEFEILNDINKWMPYFYFSEVHYNEFKDFKTLKLKWEEIQRKNQNVKYDIDLKPIFSFHKSKSWENENEIRLLYNYYELPEIFRNQIFQDFKIKKPDENIYYLKLPLCDKDGSFLDNQFSGYNCIPKLRISDIHFGPDFPKMDNFDKFQVDLKYYIFDKIKCKIESLPKERVGLV
jgi:hypothetical protein